MNYSRALIARRTTVLRIAMHNLHSAKDTKSARAMEQEIIERREFVEEEL